MSVISEWLEGQRDWVASRPVVERPAIRQIDLSAQDELGDPIGFHYEGSE